MKQISKAIYGIIAYLLFMLSYLYAVGFMANYLVPKSIDSGEDTPIVKGIFINTLLLLVFALQHTIMARPAFKNKWTKIINPAIERSTYVIFSSLALLMVFWLWEPMNLIIWEVQNKTVIIIITILYIVGHLIVFLSSFIINHFELFGLKQTFAKMHLVTSESQPFVTKYFYKFVRHPLMSGFLIAFWATPVMTIGHLYFSIIMSLYIFIAVKFYEERDLRKIHGEQYVAYQKNMPMFFPLIKKSGK